MKWLRCRYNLDGALKEYEAEFGPQGDIEVNNTYQTFTTPLQSHELFCLSFGLIVSLSFCL